MKVLYLINYAGKAGTEKYVENLVRILSPDRIEPFFAYNTAGELSEKMAAAGVPSLQVNMDKKSVFKAAKKLAGYCRENEIEVIHAQYPRENIIALLSRRYYDKPKIVLTNHLTLRLNGFSSLLWRRLNKHFTPKNHCIIAVCNEGREIMIENGVAPDRIKVIFNGIEPSGEPQKSAAIRDELGLSPECFIMTIFARFAPEKGLGFLVDVLAKLKAEVSRPFCCIICGDGELFGKISSKIDSLDISENCRLLGYRKDTSEILRGSDIYLCSSMCNEAMSFAILEAMNAGLPLVVTDVGGNRDLAEAKLRCGYVLPYGDVEGFAGAVRELMEEPETLDKLSSAATEKVEKYFNLYKLSQDVYNSYK
jgi:glycosyltransferase involved in cell wall biosynthesis